MLLSLGYHLDIYLDILLFLGVYSLTLSGDTYAHGIYTHETGILFCFHSSNHQQEDYAALSCTLLGYTGVECSTCLS